MISNIEARTLGRVAWRLLPFLGLLYFVSFLDRVNVSFAKLQMNKALDLSDTVFATGAGIFFVGYFLFEVPSNLMLERFGARRWIARIMVTWGIISAGMAFTRGENSFYALRFLLGLAEAGFFPGIILYLTYWFPAAHRAKIVGLFMVAIPVSGVIGGPISGYLLAMDGYQGLGGWQWLYLLEGLPAVVLGIVTLFLLTDRPAAAHWLEPDERDWLEGVLASERRHREAIRTYRFWETLASPRVLALALVYFGTVLGLYGLGFWLPTIVKGFGLTSIETGWVTAIPPLLGALFMVPWSRHSDRTGERVWHMVVPCFLGFLGFVIAGQLASPTAQVVFLSVAAMGIYGALPVFWSLPTAFLTGSAAAGGIALINALGNLAGYFGPVIVNWVKGPNNDFGAAMLALSGSMALAGILVLTLGHDRTMEGLSQSHTPSHEPG